MARHKDDPGTLDLMSGKLGSVPVGGEMTP
ncbi:hypothetical protein FHS76_004475 [Ochrobactrum daejeonense]|uniref:Uncharacterized protein n=1 Tax=Brucella daejeonensis TaxID=659015 RepID=A0A7W9B1J8_9HYPH|nr:hypothetical protein [Brucella daejeonensis]